MNWYLLFLGTVTIPLKATSAGAALDRVIGDYKERGVTVDVEEVRIRLARPADAGWLRDMGAAEIADELERIGKEVSA